MGEAMVTGRMAPGKKRRGGLVLQRKASTASQAINRMYDKLHRERRRVVSHGHRGGGGRSGLG